MLAISVGDNENKKMEWKGRKNKDKKKQRSDANYSEYVRGKWFCFVFKLDFILKERELYESKYTVVECKWLKIRDLLCLTCSSILVLKWQQVLPM